MTRKAIFWLAPNEVLIPADQVPGAIADVLYPPSQREVIDGVPRDPNAVERLKAEREHSRKLAEKYPKMPNDYKFRIDDLNDYLVGLNFVAEIQYRTDGGAKVGQANSTTIATADSAGPTKIRKRAALIAELLGFWPTIVLDLSDSSRNGLSECAKHRQHGFWIVEPALEWATQRGRIHKRKAMSFVTENEDSHLSPMLRHLLNLD